MTSGTRRYPQGEAFPGVIGRTVATSVPAWPVEPKPPAGAPNVLIVLLDDVGFGELGCFGGLIETPSCDRLAEGGLRYRNFHTAAICVPSRAALLTGRNPHASGMGAGRAGFPGYNGAMPKENGLLSEVLRSRGYATYALGKWHLAPASEGAAGSRRTAWPLSRGFDRFYGFIGGTTDQFVPELVYDNHPVEPPRTPKQGYHLSADLADRAIAFIGDLRAVSPSQPFFLYYCPAAGHSPHQAPAEWIERYRGKFDDGWDRCRERVLERQLTMGIVPRSTRLPSRPPEIPAWSDLNAEQQRIFARQMEAYAGFVSHADHHIGRVLDFVEQLGELDDTLIVFASDNGASSEGGLYGGLNARQDGRGPAEIQQLNAAMFDRWGGPASQENYGWAWAWVGNTPMRRWKRYLHEGGIADPLIVHWPNGIASRSEVRDAYVHIVDILPTVLDATRVEPPQTIDCVPQTPIHGVTFAHTFDDPSAPTNKTLQYYECVGSRAIWKDGWKAVIDRERGEQITEESLHKERWELYHVAEDVAEHTDLAEHHPEKLRELVELWWAEIGRHRVLPLNAANLIQTTHTTPPKIEKRPDASEARTMFVYYPGAAPVPHMNAPDVHRRPHRITAEVELPPGGAEGVLVMQGDGHFGGYALYLKDGRLRYTHNWMGLEEFRIDSPPVESGKLTLGFRYDPAGDDRGVGVLLVNGAEVARGDLPKVSPRLADVRTETRRGLSCGLASGRSLSCDFNAPFPFTGRLDRVVIDVDCRPVAKATA